MAHRHLEIYLSSYILQTWCFQTDWNWSFGYEDILFGGWPNMRKNGQFHKLYARDLVSQMGVLLRYHLDSFENMPDIGNTSKSSYFVIFMSMICGDNHLYASVLYGPMHLSFNFYAQFSSPSGSTCFSCLHLEPLHENVLRWSSSSFSSSKSSESSSSKPSSYSSSSLFWDTEHRLALCNATQQNFADLPQLKNGSGWHQHHHHYHQHEHGHQVSLQSLPIPFKLPRDVSRVAFVYLWGVFPHTGWDDNNQNSLFTYDEYSPKQVH